jgi:hypothetical protein
MGVKGVSMLVFPSTTGHLPGAASRRPNRVAHIQRLLLLHQYNQEARGTDNAISVVQSYLVSPIVLMPQH